MKDLIPAAVGDESQSSATPYSLNYYTVILLPALPGNLEEKKLMATEIMRAGTTANKSIAFHFCIEVGRGEKMQREAFEWKNLAKDRDRDGSEKGKETITRRFELLRLFSNRKHQSQSEKDGGSHYPSQLPPGAEERELVALLELTKSKQNCALFEAER